MCPAHKAPYLIPSQSYIFLSTPSWLQIIHLYRDQEGQFSRQKIKNKEEETQNFADMTMSEKGLRVISHISWLQLWLPLLIIASIFPISHSSDPDCVYSFYIRTGSVIKGGTDSIITLTFYDSYGYGIRINNIEIWGGLMGEGYDYFERGNLDIFSGRGPCLTAPICAMNLTSDGSGSGHGWYVNYVEVTATGVHEACTQQLFTVEQWLATDRSPHELTAIRDNCDNHALMLHHSESSSLVAVM